LKRFASILPKNLLWRNVIMHVDDQVTHDIAYYIYRTTRKAADGSILDARDYGLKAWRIPIYK
jgi:hypothetical protein